MISTIHLKENLKKKEGRFGLSKLIFIKCKFFQRELNHLINCKHHSPFLICVFINHYFFLLQNLTEENQHKQQKEFYLNVSETSKQTWLNKRGRKIGITKMI